MSVLLLVAIVCGLLFIVAKAWRSYEVEYRKKPGYSGGELGDSSVYLPLDAPASSSPTVHIPSHHHVGCGPSHHDVCDFGGHSGLDGSHH
jgi:hypothetical protein